MFGQGMHQESADTKNRTCGLGPLDGIAKQRDTEATSLPDLIDSQASWPGQSIGRNVLLGLIGVYMLLVLQFRGYLAPITVIPVIPTAFIGVVFGHMALGLDLTMTSWAADNLNPASTAVSDGLACFAGVTDGVRALTLSDSLA